MTTVKQLIEYLKMLPPETECQVLVEKPSYRNYGGAYDVSVESMDLREYEGNVEYTDFADNQFTKPGEPHFNKKYLQFGER
jgi:hypothetical protein